jgi:hypothetical protein
VTAAQHRQAIFPERFACLIAATRPVTEFLRGPIMIRGCDCLTGGIFIPFGVDLTPESRRPSVA